MKSKVDPKADVAQVLEVGQPRRYGKHLKRWGVVVLLVIVAAGGVRIWMTSRRSDSTPFKTEEVKRGNLTVIVTATGTLKPTNSVDVGSELSGIMKSVEVDYNSKVKVNQVLAKLDTTKLEATLTQSRAALESAKAKVLQAQATVSETRAKLVQYQKVRELSSGKVPSQSEMDGAEAAFERAKADLANYVAAVSQAEATVQANETDLSKSVIRSPINGIVLTRSIEPGQAERLSGISSAPAMSL